MNIYKHFCGLFSSFLHLSLFFTLINAKEEYGILAAESSSEKENFCMVFFNEFSTLPNKKSEAQFHILQDDTEVDWCDDHPESDPKSKVLLLSSGNCSLSLQVLNVEERGAVAALFVRPSGRVPDIVFNNTSLEINITVGLISDNSAHRLKEMKNPVSVKLFAPTSTNFDYSLLIIWLISMVTIIIGAYWSGHVRFAISHNEIIAAHSPPADLSNPPIRKSCPEPSSLNISAYVIAGLVFCMALMLVLLYFLYDYLVYIIIGMFVLACMMSLYACFEPFIMRIPGTCLKSEFCFGYALWRIDFRKIFLVGVSISIPVFWAVFRKEKDAWILQDFLGIIFCINMLKSIRLGNLKICTMLMGCLFVYDIFFVFVTPYLTPKGISIMEEVAIPRNSSEQLPMLIKVSYFGLDALSVCFPQYSILGFGDIIIPGLLVSYCHGFDLFTNKKKLYFTTSTIAYGIGLFITFGGLFLMDTAQPALLYLVPCTLLPTYLLAYCRHELRTIWEGFKFLNQCPVPDCPEIQVSCTPTETSTAASLLPPEPKLPI